MDIRSRGVTIAVAFVVVPLDVTGVPAVLGQAAAGGGADGAVLQGRVLADDGSTTPLRGTRVSVVSNGSAAAPVVSDGEGRFTVLAPTRGGWSLRITKAGFAPADVGRDTLAEPATIRLAPGAVITGRVVDAHGAPVAGVVIEAWPEQCSDACETPIPLAVLAASVRTATTDDLGEYRGCRPTPAGRSPSSDRRRRSSGSRCREAAVRAGMALYGIVGLDAVETAVSSDGLQVRRAIGSSRETRWCSCSGGTCRRPRRASCPTPPFQSRSSRRSRSQCFGRRASRPLLVRLFQLPCTAAGAPLPAGDLRLARHGSGKTRPEREGRAGLGTRRGSQISASLTA